MQSQRCEVAAHGWGHRRNAKPFADCLNGNKAADWLRGRDRNRSVATKLARASAARHLVKEELGQIYTAPLRSASS